MVRCDSAPKSFSRLTLTGLRETKKKQYMEKKIEFRKLTPEDIEVRPATIKDGKATLLCYIDSRSVVELMDEAVGPMNWNFELSQVGDQIVGRMGVWDDEKKTWVVKSDVGSESNIDATKGLISSIYKRCISRWGLQDLYTIPKINVEDDGYGCRWSVGKVEWNDKRECTFIQLVNKFGKVMYTWRKDDIPQPERKKEEPKCNCDILKDFCSKKKVEEGIDKDELLRFYQFYSERCLEWSGEFKVDALWKRWEGTRRTA